MFRARALQFALLGAFTWGSAHAAALGAGSPTPRLDRAWKRYTNVKTGYCISYPKRWVRGDAFDGDGLYAETGAQKLSSPLGLLDVSATPEADLAPKSSTFQPVSFNEDLESHLDGLRRFLKVQRTEILAQRTFTLAGAESLFLKTRYFDPRERSSWVEELVFTRRNGVLYRMELQARADQMSRFEPVFTRFVNSFQFNCHH